MSKQSALIELRDKLRQFAKERDWEQFHNPKNLVMALSGEMGELCELFQWLTPEESIELPKSAKGERLEEELADLFLYLIRLADVLDIDLIKASEAKMEKNARNYPIEQAYGNRTKYTEFKK
ncbi:nucleotide pyrophosphohydrolase [Dongshaea marina]|uniref:nucleotide pyrophosphohydrolase n=1 Tax=Dongshaea marina TaxID=2047966 RepID=UPI000D3EB342|nr:nucleotide pyrophosphohydrolase [Dongshaea marina]